MASHLALSETERQLTVGMMTYLSSYGFYYKCPQRPDGRWLGPLVTSGASNAECKQSQYVSDTFISFDSVPLDILVNWAEQLIATRQWSEAKPDYSHPISRGCRLASALTVVADQSQRRNQLGGVQSKMARSVKRCFAKPAKSIVLVDDVLGESNIEPDIDYFSTTGRVVKLIACFVNSLPECVYWYSPGNKREPIPVVSLAEIKVQRYLRDDPVVSSYIEESPSHFIADPYTKLNRNRMMVLMRKFHPELKPSA